MVTQRDIECAVPCADLIIKDDYVGLDGTKTAHNIKRSGQIFDAAKIIAAHVAQETKALREALQMASNYIRGHGWGYEPLTEDMVLAAIDAALANTAKQKEV